MDLEKIGKFIADNRKEKGLTQEELGEKLGVTNKTISRWENGNYMPDLSLLTPLSEQLGITLNELLSGEKMETGEYTKKAEENIANTVNYSNQQMERLKKKIANIIMAVGTFISISSFLMFDPESSWCSIYSIIGILIFVLGFSKYINVKKTLKKIALSVLTFLGIFTAFYTIDFISVKTFNRPPAYRYITETGDKEIIHRCGLYNVHIINPNSENEQYIISWKK